MPYAYPQGKGKDQNRRPRRLRDATNDFSEIIEVGRSEADRRRSKGITVNMPGWFVRWVLGSS